MTSCRPLPCQAGTADGAGGGGVVQAADTDAGMDAGVEALPASWTLYLKA